MEKTNKPYIWIASIIVTIGIYFIYKEFKKGSTSTNKIESMNKADAIALIIKTGNHKNQATLETFSEVFLKDWANGILNKKDTFVSNQKLYNTEGGREYNG
jgi:hypothetical protein